MIALRACFIHSLRISRGVCVEKDPYPPASQYSLYNTERNSERKSELFSQESTIRLRQITRLVGNDYIVLFLSVTFRIVYLVLKRTYMTQAINNINSITKHLEIYKHIPSYVLDAVSYSVLSVVTGIDSAFWPVKSLCQNSLMRYFTGFISWPWTLVR